MKRIVLLVFVLLIFTSCSDSSGVPADISKGDVILFGSYEQDNNAENGKEPIEWIVLDVKNGKALLLSKYALDCKAYNGITRMTDVTWENCTLRAWLNSDFLHDAFTDSEQKKILPSTLVNKGNPVYGTEGCEDTVDRVFILCLEDVTNTAYGFAGDDSLMDETRICEATEFAIANGCSVFPNDPHCGWLIRTPGNVSYTALRVRIKGDIDTFGHAVNHSAYGVRPAMWVSIG